MSRTVTAIPATKKPRSATASSGVPARRKVAAYARVSTDMEEQQSSYHAQVDYYTRYITDHAGWQLAGIYTDEGITGTSTKHREGFKRMIADALGGKIDLIITKSVSRFARNTVDTLTTVRSLKDTGVEVYFEKENIWTFDAKGELLITIMSSLAQEEARSISENVTWGHRKRFQDGKVIVPFSRFLGYDRGPNGELVINPDEAVIVRRIYDLFLEGYSYKGIARQLTAEGYTNPTGYAWSIGKIKSVLTNEKYKGDALLQKSYTADFLTKKQIKNNGEVPQYYVTGDHEAIVNPGVHDFVQTIINQGRKPGGSFSRQRLFSATIRCGECGSWYGSKTWHAGNKYEKRIWRCNHKYDGQQKCDTPSFDEETIKNAFSAALKQMLHGQTAVDEVLDQAVRAELDTSTLEAEAEKLLAEVESAAAAIDKLIDRNAKSTLNQDEYTRRFNALTTRHSKLADQRESLTSHIIDKQNRLKAYEYYKAEITKLDGTRFEFTPYLFTPSSTTPPSRQTAPSNSPSETEAPRLLADRYIQPTMKQAGKPQILQSLLNINFCCSFMRMRVSDCEHRPSKKSEESFLLVFSGLAVELG